MKTYLVNNADLLWDESEAGGPSRLRQAAWEVDRIRMRADWLEGRDRVLIELVFGQGVPTARLAGMMGVGPRAARRKLRQLVRRLHNPDYLFCLQHRQKFTLSERDLLRRHLVQGMTILQTASLCGCSKHQVEKTIRKLRELQARWQQLTCPASLKICKTVWTDGSQQARSAYQDEERFEWNS